MKRYSLFASTQKQAHDIIEDPEGAWVKYEDVRDGFGEGWSGVIDVLSGWDVVTRWRSSVFHLSRKKMEE